MHDKMLKIYKKTGQCRTKIEKRDTAGHCRTYCGHHVFVNTIQKLQWLENSSLLIFMELKMVENENQLNFFFHF